MAGANDRRVRCSRVSFLLLITRVQNVKVSSNSKTPSAAEQAAIIARWFVELEKCQRLRYLVPHDETYLDWVKEATGTIEVEAGGTLG